MEKTEKKLRILHLEDDDLDAELVEQILIGENIPIELTRVDRKEAFTAALQKDRYDLVMADNSVTGFDGRSALHLVQDISPDTPFIFVSGTIGEEVAIEALKEGAADYVLKQRLSRLGPVVQQVLKQSEEHRRREAAEEAARRNEERFRALIENSSDAILLLDENFKVVYASPSTLRISGFTPEELASTQTLEGIHPDDIENLENAVREAVANPGVVISALYHARRKDGSWFLIDASIKSLLDVPSVNAVVFNYRDVTEQKQAEAQLAAANRHIRVLFDNLDQVLFTIAMPEQRLLQISPACERLYGVPPNAFIEDPLLWLKMIHPDDHPLIDLERDIYKSGQLETGVYRIIRPDGETRWAEIKIKPSVNENGEVIRIDGIVSDITQRRQDEEEIRRRAAYQTALNSIIMAASRAEASPKDILMTVLKHTLKAFGLKKGAIWVEGRETVLFDLPLSISESFNFLTARPAISDTGSLMAREWHSEDKTANDKFSQILSECGVRAALSAPLWQGKKRVGGILIVSQQPRQWSTDESMLVKAVGRQVSIVTERTRLLEETRQYVNELEVINRISTVLRSAVTLEEMLPVFLDETLAVFKARYGSIWLYDEETDLVKLMIMRGWEPEIAAQFQAVQPGQGIAGHVYATGEFYNSEELLLDPHLSTINRRLIPPGLGGAVVPIHSEAGILGVLFVNLVNYNKFQPGEVRLIRTLAEIAGNAIRRMLHYKKIQVQVQRLTALRTIDTAINNTFNLKITLDLVLEQVKQQQGVDAADVLLLDEETMTLTFSTGVGFKTGAAHSCELKGGEGYTGQIVVDHRMIGSPDTIQAEPAFERKEMLAAEDFVAYYAVPLVGKGRTLGVLELFNRTPLNPSRDWFDFYEILAGQAAIALDNSMLFEDLERSNQELFAAYDATIEGWSMALDLRDEETEGHTQRVTEISMALAQAMNMSEEELAFVRWGALLHDIGKMGIPDAILLKPGPLTDEEREIMKQHPIFAERMLAPIAYLREAMDIPIYHHERWNGGGYPKGLKGEEIPLAARIFAVADVWDALRSDRPYREAWPASRVKAYILEHSGIDFDPEVVDAFVKIVQE